MNGGPAWGTCVGSLILHLDGTVAGRTNDDELERCAGWHQITMTIHNTNSENINRDQKTPSSG